MIFPVSATQRNSVAGQSGGIEMSERDWKEEQREVLARLFDAVFGRREASQDEIGRDIRWLGTAKEQLEDGDE